VLSLDEPHWRKVGAYYKYLPVTSSTINPVRFGEYYDRKLTYAEIVEHVKQIAAQYPQITLKEEGPSTGDLPIYSLNMGKPGAPLYFIYAAAHGTEWEPAYGVMTFAKRVAEGRMTDVVDLDKVAIKIVPIFNPWGYDNRRRQNANGVDLNRQGDHRWAEYKGRDSNKDGKYAPKDYDFKGAGPFSQPESKTYKAIIDAAENLYCVLDYHGNATATSNKVSILAATAHEDNEERGYEMQRIVNSRLVGRHLLWQNAEDKPSQYIIRHTVISSGSPFLMNTSARGRFGTLVEITAGYRSTYGTVLQTDVVCEVCRGLFVAYSPQRRGGR